MKLRHWLLIGFGVLIVALVSRFPLLMHLTMVRDPHFGRFVLSRPDGNPRGMVMYFSDNGGWQERDQSTVDALAERGIMAVGLDTDRYLAHIAQGKSRECRYLAENLKVLAHQLEREAKMQTYFAPILAGRGTGEQLAENIFAQAPQDTLRGVFSMPRATETGEPSFNMCHADQAPLTQQRYAFREPINAEQPGTLIDAILKHISAKTSPGSASDTSNLPLIEMPAKRGGGGTLAIVLSGDGGWRDLDKTIAEGLQKDHINVVGWDSLRYFLTAKTPNELGLAMQQVIEHYEAKWHTKRTILIGYSFGANVIPLVYSRLAQPQRERISQVALLGPEKSTTLQIHLGDLIGVPNTINTWTTYPDATKIEPRLVLCVYGETESESLCPLLQHTGVTVVREPGGHHFGGEYESIEKRILEFGKTKQAPTQGKRSHALAPLSNERYV